MEAAQRVIPKVTNSPRPRLRILDHHHSIHPRLHLDLRPLLS